MTTHDFRSFSGFIFSSSNVGVSQFGQNMMRERKKTHFRLKFQGYHDQKRSNFFSFVQQVKNIPGISRTGRLF